MTKTIGQRFYEQHQRAVYAFEIGKSKFKPKPILTDKKAFDAFVVFIDTHNKSGRTQKLYRDIIRIYEYYNLQNDDIVAICLTK